MFLIATVFQNSTGKEEDEGRDDFNEDTFGDGAVGKFTILMHNSEVGL